jgi:hypothetical protein
MIVPVARLRPYCTMGVIAHDVLGGSNIRDAWEEVNLPDIWPFCYLRQRDSVFHFYSYKACFET